MPQPPQLLLSLWKLTQAFPAPLPQVFSGGAHCTVQVPALQVFPTAQTVPHTPQLRLSLCRFAQVLAAPLLHVLSAEGQETAQVPLPQT